jgi:hypothetical protein
MDERGFTEPPKGFEEQELFAFHMERCLHTHDSRVARPAL